MKKSYAAERQFAKQVIKTLEENGEDFPGICSVISYLSDDVMDEICDKLPKLHKYLSNRLNYKYSPVGFRCIGREKGYGGWFFIAKPYYHTNRIKLLKKVYKIK